MSSLRRRGDKEWTVVLELGRDGNGKRRQQYVRFRGTKRQAETELRRLSTQVDEGTFIIPSKITLGQWLDLWLENSVRGICRQSTFIAYRNAIEGHLKPSLGGHRLQQLSFEHIEGHYRRSKLSPATLNQHHAVLSRALSSAQRRKLVKENVARLVENKPRKDAGDLPEHVRSSSWTKEQATRFLQVCRNEDPQTAAFYSVALETGVRKGELAGFRWTDLDEQGRILRVNVQLRLTRQGQPPEWIPPKTKQGIRPIRISETLLDLLRLHRQHQRELKMRNRRHFQDYGLMFSKDWEHICSRNDHLGEPLAINNLNRQLNRLIEKAGVPQISFHGLRHTSASLALEAGMPAKVVQERLGHATISITLGIYQHVSADMQQASAATMESILKG